MASVSYVEHYIPFGIRPHCFWLNDVINRKLSLNVAKKQHKVTNMYWCQTIKFKTTTQSRLSFFLFFFNSVQLHCRPLLLTFDNTKPTEQNTQSLSSLFVCTYNHTQLWITREEMSLLLHFIKTMCLKITLKKNNKGSFKKKNRFPRFSAKYLPT